MTTGLSMKTGAIGAVALAAVAALAYYFLAVPQEDTVADVPKADVYAGLEAQEVTEDGFVFGDVIIGDPNAPVTVVEYASFTCPHCANFHTQSWPTIKRDYVDTGKVRFVLREVYFDQFGLWGALVARCSGPERYHDVVDALLKDQNTWFGAHRAAFSQTQNAGPIVEELMKIGRRVGMSNERMQECVTDVGLRDRLVAAFQDQSGRDNIRSTPSFLINGELTTGAQSPAAMAALIDAHL